MGYKLTGMYIGTNKVRPSTPRVPDATRTLLYLQLNNNVTDSSGNSVSVSGQALGYGTIGNNHYAEVTDLTRNSGTTIKPPSGLCQPIGTGDFTVSFFFLPVDNSNKGEPAWLFGDWYDTGNPRPGICIRWDNDNKVHWTDDGSWTHDVTVPCSLNNRHYHTYVRKNGVAYCYLNGQLVGQHTHTVNLSNVNKFVILNRNDYDPQIWGNTGAKISEVILENVAWTEDEITGYFNYQKGNYGIS